MRFDSPQAAEATDYHLARVPETSDLGVLSKAAMHCQACPLYRNATQTVFGEGRSTAKIIFIGEQPGDQEDLAGKPFVGFMQDPGSMRTESGVRMKRAQQV